MTAVVPAFFSSFKTVSSWVHTFRLGTHEEESGSLELEANLVYIENFKSVRATQ